jgi:hypothetical protein
MGAMLSKRQELARLWGSVVTRPSWQLVLAVLVSAWTLAWIVGQAGPQRSPIGLLRDAVAWAGAPTGWLDAAIGWLADSRRHGLLGGLAVAGGLSWAATTERRQAPALLGWLAVMAAGQGIGYPGAVHRAVLAMACFVGLLLLLSLPWRRAVVVRRVVLLPRDVLRAGVVAAALTAVVPLLAPGIAVTRLCRPYVTRPPRPDPTRRPVPVPRQRAGGTPVAPSRADPVHPPRRP